MPIRAQSKYGRSNTIMDINRKERLLFSLHQNIEIYLTLSNGDYLAFINEI
jgi:hypothetical protein